MKDWKEFEKELLSDPETKREYDKLGPQFEVISALIRTRIETGLTQKELAQKLGTKQSAIARLESGNSNPSIGFLQKLAQAMNMKLTIKFT
jgi:ribosome-binding protein aMBF1 (putative translation factor)